MPNAKIIYSRGFPYGAPLVMIRGGGTRQEPVKQWLREQGFRWDSRLHAWTNYGYKADVHAWLLMLRDVFGCEISPKEGMDAGHVVDLPPSEVHHG